MTSCTSKRLCSHHPARKSCETEEVEALGGGGSTLLLLGIAPSVCAAGIASCTAWDRAEARGPSESSSRIGPRLPSTAS